jgi:hypothetical protein
LVFEVVADLWVEDGQQSVELVHLDFQDFKLVGEELFESSLHEVLEDTIC